EAGRAVAQRTPVGMRRQPLQAERAHHERARPDRGEDDLGAHVSLAAAASSAPAAPSVVAISVNRMSSGSSRVVRRTVWRIPRYAMTSAGTAPPQMNTTSPG